MKRLLILPLALIITSCASHLSKQQCETISWKSEGYQDSVNGKMPRDLSRAIEDCAKFNLKVDTNLYMQGWRQGARVFCRPSEETGFIDGQNGKSINAINYRIPVCKRAGITLNLTDYKKGRARGLRQYCTFENGANIARAGQQLPTICPPALKKKFKDGWLSGKKEYCDQPANAFALGKAGSAYPAICPANLYVAFKSEYDRGMLIGQQINRAKARISEIDNYINSKKFRFGLEQSASGYYHLTKDQSPEAQSTLSEINNLVRERNDIQRDLFNLQTKR